MAAGFPNCGSAGYSPGGPITSCQRKSVGFFPRQQNRSLRHSAAASVLLGTAKSSTLARNLATLEEEVPAEAGQMLGQFVVT
jgi:hypothetical protein